MLLQTVSGRIVFPQSMGTIISPDVTAGLVHLAFGYIVTALFLGFLLLMVKLMTEKLGLSRLWR